MFIQVDDYNSPKTYAIVDGSMRETFNEWFNSVEYIFDAYWIVDSGSTKGSLAVGTLSINYCDSFASELNGLDTYQGMSVEEVLVRSDILKSQPLPNPKNFSISRHAPKEVKSYASAIFGNGKAWVEGRGNGAENDLVFKDLVETWFNLPELPPGTSTWLKFVK